MYDMRLIFCR